MQEYGTERTGEALEGTADGAAPKGRRETVAGALDSASERLHARAERMQGDRLKHDGVLAGAAEKTASALGSTASFVREFDTREVIDDAAALTKRHPGIALAAAAVLGFFVGRALTRNNT